MSSTPVATDPIDLLNTTWHPHLEDDYFGEPFVDIDEWRDTPIRHRYVHGGFRDTDTLFSFYFPVPEKYEGRFFQHVTPVPQSENLAQDPSIARSKITFSVDSGAYFVETNGGGPDAANPMSGMDPTIGAYRANAASAQFSRVVARKLYGEHRPYGYLYGGSGGGYRTMGAAENTEGVWDGFAPHVIGSSMAIPNVFSVRMHAQRILRDKFPAIVEAYDVGGDPHSLDLTPQEAAAFEEVTRMGFPVRSWFGWRTMGMHAFSVLYPGVMMADPSYGEDFWTKPGYLGSDLDSSVHADRVRLETTVAERIEQSNSTSRGLTAGGVDESYQHAAAPAGVSALRLAAAPDGWMLGAQLMVHSGDAAGAVIQIAGVDGDVVSVEPGQEHLVGGVAVGDEVTLDNSSFLAVQTYHRHQVPSPDYTVWDQFRDDNGEPRYPQRQMLLGPLLSRGASGTLQSGDYKGKMIVVACLLDREAFPWQADWYRRKVAEHLGDAETDSFRLWYIDNALHGDEGEQEFPARSVEYVGALETALRQLAAWVEEGIDPSASTVYEIADGQVIVPENADDRHGVQPTVRLTLDGASSTTVSAGETVVIRVDVDAPDGGVVNEIIPVRTSATGEERLGEPIPITPAAQVSAEWTAAFDEPGRTHYLAVRVSAQTGGDPADPHAQVHNIARARVDVRS